MEVVSIRFVSAVRRGRVTAIGSRHVIGMLSRLQYHYSHYLLLSRVLAH